MKYIIEREVKNMVGLLAVSKAGHDKNHIYIIMKETLEHVYLADGVSRKIDHLKKKNKKHIQIVKKVKKDEIQSKIADESISDDFVKYIIKEYCISTNTM